MPSQELFEDPALLDAMVRRASQAPELYLPGPYWRAKTWAAKRELRRVGLQNFRGEHSGAGTSFTDNLRIDARTTLATPKGRALRFALRSFPLSLVFDDQVALTRSYAREALDLMGARISETPQARELASRYKLEDSLLGGCVETCVIDGERVSTLYMTRLQLLDKVRALAPLDRARSLMEIGGGFGVNVHLLVTNFPSLRKVVYLDIVPNLYVGTCYLKTLFGNAVRDFSETDRLDRITFHDDDRLEIVAIAPWQIEKLDLSIDVFWNAHSFQEMPREVIANYAQKVTALADPGAMSIVLGAYEGGMPTTVPPDELPGFFEGREFRAEAFWNLGKPVEGRIDPTKDARLRLFVSSSG